ncbi:MULTISPECIES: MOSC domain-containing protein [unclassified Shewanella]|uniref:MOSC domain-containing protein n=1 Tax=unclassified Shewanella TaxID=196818 RepID=UPI000C855ED1|nr:MULTISPECIES: MOSC domain-containing protein [unclassified Shewanella]MDO6619095.1 MOSC domain-containing protein [Shewanella sp. 6_MG-2023]MDO6640925.1 MOSC domain-containing protein [Shewanella sp. 5_MG-2023]MDO6776050.1 MOSC domain-containing protein [Shewanella sp. 3_MG-2023]PMG30879.1 molybdenum cofactor biosysynthesis protein [Shewanella sp. 10N.286.52.C2]PMG40888.1 molybdenum cofactor biosysynthesis protein [Shewanella sp. 10N.286.52.B9]
MISLHAIAYKTAKKGPMKPVFCAKVSLLKGVENDIFGKPGKRQVTVMSQQQWQLACNEINADLDWLTRRANILIDGYKFSAADVGKVIKLGNDVSLLITGETDPCKKMEQSQQGLEKALTPDWRGGVTCKVITEGLIQIDDQVSIITI